MGDVIDLAQYRKDNNKRVLEKMKAGDNLCTSTTEDSWFPPKGTFDRQKGRMVPAAPPSSPPPTSSPVDLYVQSTRQLIDNFRTQLSSVPEDATVGVRKSDLTMLLNALESFLPPF